jgi:hypothetical protein
MVLYGFIAIISIIYVDNHGISEDVKNSLSLWYQLRWKKRIHDPFDEFRYLEGHPKLPGEEVMELEAQLRRYLGEVTPKLGEPARGTMVYHHLKQIHLKLHLKRVFHATSSCKYNI